ncbi:MAG TPA: bifunctional serine/threonine-protein kinase/formylglycine-generating enzyme family protein [Rhodanobacteraceae bacterium]|nr:bifunctional serine/threonine-protein kinase/formylglycine-generating enzyme family protein [Rhodanobacteraceae bacterium]
MTGRVMANLKLPFEIDGYRIVRRLGLGGMATVYLGIQRSLGRPVAIKVLATDHTQSEELVKRFEHEARTIARLDHPHIVNIFDVGRTSTGQIYYTMPYLPNGDLSARNLRDDESRVIEIIRALADALGYAHEQGIVHRDVKPENVLFDKLDRPLLADFGIALSEASHQPRVTREGATIGSSGYMSPEQARSQPLDGRSDIYSLGVLCYELLTGEMPFRGPDTLSVALAHIENPVPRLPALRRLWQPFIDKAMAKRPEARFQSAEEVIAALDAIEQRIRTPPTRGPMRWWRAIAERTAAIPRRSRALAIGLLIALALASLIVLLPHTADPAASPPPHLAAPAATPAPTTVAADKSDSSSPVQTAPESAPAAIGETAETAAAQPAIDATAVDAMLADAKALAARGRLFAPKGNNAAERYLAALDADPSRRDAVRGIERLIAELARQTTQAIERADTDATRSSIERALALADAAKLRKSKTFDTYRKAVRDAIDKRRRSGHGPFDAGELAALAPIKPALAMLDPREADALAADLDRPANLLRHGGKFRDAGGPELALIPADSDPGDRLGYPYAIGVTDVTRGAYRAFAQATGRPASRCRESQSLFARSRDLGWESPGFDQTDDHPVVCVSWQDAKAYADWLSRRTAQHYRLPTQQEWLRVAQTIVVASGCGSGNFSVDSCDDGYANTAPVAHFPATRYGLYDVVGNISVWTADCAEPSGSGDCREHAIRGLSWHDERDPAQVWREEKGADDIGYATTGFRILREISADNASLAGPG